MKLSVIVSTYNAPDWLERSLWGFAAQSWRDFEVVVADDGSGPETRERVEQVRSASGLELQHVWHEDQGFQKSRILNRAIEAARASYLVFTDGDCIPRSDFLAAHLALARRGRFLSGGYVKLSLAVSRAVERADVEEGRVFDPRWLSELGMSRIPLKLRTRAPWAGWLDALTPTRASWNGHNASGWADDLVRVNGFDERMGYGGQDRELGERLENAGIRGLQVRHRAVCVHLDHGRPYVDEARWARNRQIREETRRSKATWTEHGIAQDPPALRSGPGRGDPEREGEAGGPSPT